MNNKGKIFLDIQEHLLNDDKPSIYLKQSLEKGLFDEYPLSMIKELTYIKQNPKYHPEGNVFIHTMMVIDEGAKIREKSKNKKAFMWTLLLHDLGKKTTTKIRKGKITSYDHDVESERMSKEFLTYFNQHEEFIREVSSLARWHMQSLFATKSVKFQNIDEMLENVDKDEIVLVAMADRMGRGILDSKDIEKTKSDIDIFRRLINEKKKTLIK